MTEFNSEDMFQKFVLLRRRIEGSLYRYALEVGYALSTSFFALFILKSSKKALNS